MLTLVPGGFLKTAGDGVLSSLVVDGTTLVVNVPSYEDRVGIGTATPATQLHGTGIAAFGDSVTAARATRPLNLISSNATQRIWRFTSDTNLDPAVELIWGNKATPSTAGNFYWDFYLEGADGSFRIRDRTEDVNLTRMFVGADGKIGFGTIVPVGSGHFARSDSLSNYLYFTNSTTGHTGNDGFTIGIDAEERVRIRQREAKDMLFDTSNTTRVTITSGGNVVIAIAGIPGADPSSAGQLWRDGTDLKISEG